MCRRPRGSVGGELAAYDICMRTVSYAALICFCIATLSYAASAQVPRPDATPEALDSDGDGLSDELEEALLVRFVPNFQVDPQDCAGTPAAFLPGKPDPVAAPGNGIIYGQATPRVLKSFAGPVVELRYFHLWSSDCGRMGHALDTEHVSALIALRSGTANADGRAIYWYAAAHEDTMCDASQIARASTVKALDAGAVVWISSGKHASFLNQELCRHGCGGDRCSATQPLRVMRIVNLGEQEHPMNGSLWVASSEWPLAKKLMRSDFDPAVLTRLAQLPDSDIAWVNPSKRRAQGTIAAAGSTVDALAVGNRKTDTAISLAGGATGNALATTRSKVGQSLKKTAGGVGRILGAR